MFSLTKGDKPCPSLIGMIGFASAAILGLWHKVGGLTKVTSIRLLVEVSASLHVKWKACGGEIADRIDERDPSSCLMSRDVHLFWRPSALQSRTTKVH
jgi:hypothetical protein